MADRLTLDQEVLVWLRRQIGERLGRFGEAAVGAAPPSARLTLLGLSMPDLDALELSIQSRWGVSLTLGSSTDTVRAIAEAITGMQGRA